MILAALIALGGQSCSKGDELADGGVRNAQFEECNLHAGGFDGELTVAIEDVVANMDIRVEGPGSDERSASFTENGNQYEYNENGKVGLEEFYEIIGSSDGDLDISIDIDGATEDTRLIISADGQQDIWFDFDDLDCLPDLPEGSNFVGQPQVFACINDGGAMNMNVQYTLDAMPGDGILNSVVFNAPGAQAGSTATVNGIAFPLGASVDIPLTSSSFIVEYNLVGADSDTDVTVQHLDA